MRRVLLVVSLALVAAWPVSARRSLPATDDLTRIAVTLGTNWTAAYGAITDWALTNVNPVGATGAAAGADVMLDYWNADSFTSDQYSQANIIQSVNGYGAQLAVRLSGSGGTRNGYEFDLYLGGRFQKWVNGTGSSVGTCSITWTDGHTMKLSATGSGTVTLTLYDNGTPTACTATDSSSTVTGGSPGISGYADGSAGRISNWQGDNVGGGGSTFPPALLNSPVRCCRLAR